MTHFHPSILKKHDIRGVFPEEITENSATILGKIFAEQNGTSPVMVVGADGRLSSPVLLDAVIKGCLEQGATVYNVGTVPSPMLYYASQILHAQAGIMVTASHSPAHYNGFKLIVNQQPFYGADLQQLQNISLPPASAVKGILKTLDVREKYVQCIVKNLPLKFSKRLKIAWDPGHGAVATILQDLLCHLDADHFVINNTIDGHFPSHHPDPMVLANMQQLRQLVLQQNADIGFGFDGDGDRLGIIDNTGKQWDNDLILGVFAKYLLKENPGSSILLDIKSSQTIFDAIRRWGGDARFVPTGYATLRARMNEYKALLGGEVSGHFVFADYYYGYDDALYAAIRFLTIALEWPGTISDHLNQFSQQLPHMVAMPALYIPCPAKHGKILIEAVRQHLIQKGRQFIAIDGLRVQTPQGWWLVRQSQTEDSIVVRCEAFHHDGLAQLKKEIEFYFNENGFGHYFAQ